MSFDRSTARRLGLKTPASRAVGVNIAVTDIKLVLRPFTARSSSSRFRPTAEGRKVIGSDGEAKVHEVVWNCIFQRVLTGALRGRWSWRSVRPTEFEVVREQRWSPYDPGASLKELANQNRLSSTYVGGALRCFRSGGYLATAVMRGARRLKGQCGTCLKACWTP